ncbi:hypothetical protein STAQ_42460 [Allostella sp. ATCC 35155]|nr:hypothetical protein STAQ_42460 [Stella sp. ATCC 35155]
MEDGIDAIHRSAHLLDIEEVAALDFQAVTGHPRNAVKATDIARGAVADEGADAPSAGEEASAEPAADETSGTGHECEPPAAGHGRGAVGHPAAPSAAAANVWARCKSSGEPTSIQRPPCG